MHQLVQQPAKRLATKSIIEQIQTGYCSSEQIKVCVCVLWGLLDSDGVIMMMMLHWTIISAPHCEDSGSISQLGGVFVCAVSVVLPTVQLTHWGHLDAPVYLR